MQAFARPPNNNNNNNHQNPINNQRNRNAASISSSSVTPTTPYFQGAPLSKLITIATAASYAVFEIGGLRGSSVVSLDWQAVLFEGQIYRLFMYTMTFASIGELVVGLAVLCPLLRRFEREMGTRKFTSFLLFKCLPVSTILQCLLLELSDLSDNNTSESSFAPGPYPHIGALLYLYHRYTPKQHPRLFGLLGIHFSEKAFIYGLALQSTISSGWYSVLPVAVGYLAGRFATSPSLHTLLGAGWDVIPLPSPLINAATAVGRALGLEALSYAPTTGAVGRGGGRVVAPGALGFGLGRDRRGRPTPGRGDGRAPLGAAPAPVPERFQAPAPPPPPSPGAIEQLTAMGFDREAAERALQATDNNVGAAANRLLSGS